MFKRKDSLSLNFHFWFVAECKFYQVVYFLAVIYKVANKLLLKPKSRLNVSFIFNIMSNISLLFLTWNLSYFLKKNQNCLLSIWNFEAPKDDSFIVKHNQIIQLSLFISICYLKECRLAIQNVVSRLRTQLNTVKNNLES